MNTTQRTACGRRDCSHSIHRGRYLTFGRGHLADGHWEYPCAECARAFDRNREECRARTRETLLLNGADEASVDLYLADVAVWLHNEAWPFANESELNCHGFEQSGAELALAGAY